MQSASSWAGSSRQVGRDFCPSHQRVRLLCQPGAPFNHRVNVCVAASMDPEFLKILAYAVPKNKCWFRVVSCKICPSTHLWFSSAVKSCNFLAEAQTVLQGLAWAQKVLHCVCQHMPVDSKAKTPYLLIPNWRVACYQCRSWRRAPL